MSASNNDDDIDPLPATFAKERATMRTRRAPDA